jgi:hypothetical protein
MPVKPYNSPAAIQDIVKYICLAAVLALRCKKSLTDQMKIGFFIILQNVVVMQKIKILFMSQC